MYESDEPGEPGDTGLCDCDEDDWYDHDQHSEMPDPYPDPYPDADDESAPLVPLPPVTDWSDSWGGPSSHYPTW